MTQRNSIVLPELQNLFFIGRLRSSAISNSGTVRKKQRLSKNETYFTIHNILYSTLNFVKNLKDIKVNAKDKKKRKKKITETTRILSLDNLKARTSSPFISFFEFSYPLLQNKNILHQLIFKENRQRNILADQIILTFHLSSNSLKAQHLRNKSFTGNEKVGLQKIQCGQSSFIYFL